MNIWNRIRTPLLIFSLGLNIAFIVFWAARTVGGLTSPSTDVAAPRDHNMVDALREIHRELGVNPEQMETLRSQFIQFRAEIQKTRDEIEKLHPQMMELLTDPEVDKDAVRAKREEIFAVQKKMQGLVIDHILAEREILTPEQQKRFFKMLRSRCLGGGGHMSGFGGHPGQPPCPPGGNGRNRRSP
ncbi:MAG: periplasmic heavy metal sensor [bacterium]